MIVGFIGVGILLKAAQLAQSIGGTVTTTSGSALLAGTIGGAVGSALSTLKMPMSVVGGASTLLGGSGDKSGSSAMNAIRSDLIKAESQSPISKTFNRIERSIGRETSTQPETQRESTSS